MDSKNKVKEIKPHKGGQERFVTSNCDVVFFGGVLGSGKLLDINELVLTPKGWVRNGDLQIGQYVSTPFGKPAKITEIYDHKDKDIYELETIDGRKSMCGIEHLWTFYTQKKGLSFLDGIRTETTKDIICRLRKKQSCYLPIHDYKCIVDDSEIDDFKLFISTCVSQNKLKVKSRYTYSTSNKYVLDKIIQYARRLSYSPTYKFDGIEYKIHIYKYNRIRIKSIKKKYKNDARCILIDDDLHLYITNDFIVTHNTAGAILKCAYHLNNKDFRAMYLRKTLKEAKQGGGMVDQFKRLYGNMLTYKMSDSPRLTAKSGAFIDITQVYDERPDQLMENIKGGEYALIYLDELTGFQFTTLTYLLSRNRSVSGCKAQLIATTNPKKNHWLRTFLDWYIDPEGIGQILPERDGVVRYFYIKGKTVDNIVWGNSKEEVYEQCKTQIDRLVEQFRGVATYKDFIKSFVFYQGNMSENTEILANNKGYVGSVATMGEAGQNIYLLGGWNVDEDIDEEQKEIPYNVALRMFDNDPQTNSDIWITADLAAEGTDNFIAIVWNGLHIIDIVILPKTTPRQNAVSLITIANKYKIPYNRILFDAINGSYIRDYIPDARMFKSSWGKNKGGLYHTTYNNIKSECAYRFVVAVNNNMISIDSDLAQRKYVHAKLGNYITIKTEFIQECGVIFFEEDNYGHRKIGNKKEMNRMLGKNRSMDLIDPMIMRFYPLLKVPIGEELTLNFKSKDNRVTANPFDESGESDLDTILTF